jgi:hypothetical protein
MKQLRNSQIETTIVTRSHMAAVPGTAADVGQGGCQGCRARPDRACAACGVPASIWTEAGDGRHAVAWCAACHELLLSGRPENAQPLQYLPAREPVPAA